MDKNFVIKKLTDICCVVNELQNEICKDSFTTRASERVVSAYEKLEQELKITTECNRNTMDKITELRKIIKDKDEQINDLQERSDDLQEQLNNRCEQVEQLECKLNSVYDKIDTLYRITSGNIE